MCQNVVVEVPKKRADTKLRVCPFCMSLDLEVWKHSSGKYLAGYNVNCRRCEAAGPMRLDIGAALDMWNIRATD